MPRRFRIVFPGHPHHVIQRGNRHQRVFFSDSDREFYLECVRKWCDKCEIKIYAYCLMDNHVHLVLLPSNWGALARAVGETHKAYTKMINKREGWTGFLWQGRFRSFILDEAYFWTVMRYVELNPVRAGMVRRPDDYCWSSARAHLGLEKNPVLDEVKLLPNWRNILRRDLSSQELNEIRLSCASGNPLGEEGFLNMVKRELGIDWGPKKRGPKTVS